MKTFLLEVEDDPQYLGHTLVSLYEYSDGIKPCGSISVPTVKHVGRGAAALLSGQYGNPNDKPPLRERTIRHEPGQGTLCVSPDGERLVWLPSERGDGHPSSRDFDDYQGA